MGWLSQEGLSDEALYARARRGDLRAFNRLYARHEAALFGFILRCLGSASRAEAEELFHDVFLQAMTGAEPRFDEAKFGPWLYRVARNRCANWHRSRMRLANAVARIAAEPGEALGPELRLLAAERAAAMAQAVEGLPESLARLFTLRTAGLSYAEIAEELRVPIGTVKSRLHALVIQLKGRLEP